MTSRLDAICFGAAEPLALARFWAAVLGRDTADEPGGVALLPGDDAVIRLRFLPVDEPKTGPNRMHFDLTSPSPEEQQRTVARALDAGARHIDVGQLPEEGHVVLADPEGNEFCVIEAGNKFLAGCGFVGALSCDGSPEVGYFWSAALGWPLVWDQDQETAIQSPHGGMKITWGGPPDRAKTGRNRLFLDLVPAGEIDRLISLGATLTSTAAGHVELIDPEGNEFRVLTK
jgi:hypothetical protein